MREEYLAKVKERYEQNQKSLESIQRATLALDKAVTSFNFDTVAIDATLIDNFRDAENLTKLAIVDLKEDLKVTE